jgi:hypothetical protein
LVKQRCYQMQKHELDHLNYYFLHLRKYNFLIHLLNDMSRWLFVENTYQFSDSLFFLIIKGQVG